MTGKIISDFQTIHGYAKHESRERIYNTWLCMRNRCNNPNHPKYAIYGGRGICVCQEWNDFQNFHDWAIHNGYKDDLEIDRIDVNGNYEPANCRFVTDLIQARNTTRCKYKEVNGVRMCGTEIAEKYGLSYKEYQNMMYMGRKGEDMEEYAIAAHNT